MARGKGRGKGPNLFIASFYAPGTFVVTIISTPILIKTKLKKRTWQLFLIALKIVLLTERKLQFAFHLGMARGIPRPSILEVPDLFSLLDSPRNRF